MAGKPVRDAPSPPKSPIIATRVLHHPWADPPKGFARHQLTIRWRLREDGSITSTIEAILDAKGRKVDRARWPGNLYPAEFPELDGQDRIICLTGDLSDPRGRLEAWLVDSARAHDLTPVVKIVKRP